MPFPLFRNFQQRRKAAQAQATKTAKATVRRAASSRPARELRQSAREARTQVEQLIDTAARQLGKIGPILKSLLRLGQASPEETLDVMQQAVRESGRKPITEADVRPKPPQRSSVTRQPQPDITFREYPAAEINRTPNVIEVMVGGRKRRYDPNDPTISGEMIEVTSSNVHSIGFDFNFADPMKGTLKVRFLQGPKDKKIAGPTYHYFDVHPDVFETFKVAASKGKFVWDRLRVRGTVSGHQYRYNLAGIRAGYVPRAAKRFGSNEYFVQRRFTGKNKQGEIRTFQSRLPEQRVGRYEPSRAIPNRGIPNRGD